MKAARFQVKLAARYVGSDGGEPVYVLPEGVERPDEAGFVILTGVPEVNGVQVRVFRVKEPYGSR